MSSKKKNKIKYFRISLIFRQVINSNEAVVDLNKQKLVQSTVFQRAYSSM